MSDYGKKSGKAPLRALPAGFLAAAVIAAAAAATTAVVIVGTATTTTVAAATTAVVRAAATKQDYKDEDYPETGITAKTITAHN